MAGLWLTGDQAQGSMWRGHGIVAGWSPSWLGDWLNAFGQTEISKVTRSTLFGSTVRRNRTPGFLVRSRRFCGFNTEFRLPWSHWGDSIQGGINHTQQANTPVTLAFAREGGGCLAIERSPPHRRGAPGVLTMRCYRSGPRPSRNWLMGWRVGHRNQLVRDRVVDFVWRTSVHRVEHAH